jgi:excinuclease ABC subunit B
MTPEGPPLRRARRPAAAAAPFRLTTAFRPAGDQPTAIDALVAGDGAGKKHQVLLGVTGSGKTFTVANVIARLGRPALVLAPNKTLAAQLFDELRLLFPENAVEYFVSFYDYYQPEAYLPGPDLYIEKDSSINDRIDRMRHSATRAVLTRRDAIVVASVSCIYALGSPEEYAAMHVAVKPGERIDRDEVIRRLVRIQYRRDDLERGRGAFRARGDVLEVGPADRDDRVVRIEWFGDEIERIEEVDPLTGEILRAVKEAAFYPSSHYVTREEALERACGAIEEELEERIRFYRYAKKPVEAERIARRTRYDLELLRETGFCPGIENYSRHLDGRAPGEPPWTLLDYFPEDFLLVVDESHVTIPQVGGMYLGDRRRKETLVEYGFRLPCAIDNRPLTFAEFEVRMDRSLYVSATPGPWEKAKAGGIDAEQVIRPTGIIDPPVILRPATGQVDDVLHEIRKRAERKERVLVTTLTKRMAEELTEHLAEVGVKVRYLHSDVTTLERAEILRDLRLGVFDALVGINLLREGLDLPEVSLVAVLDADREGFLRSETSLVQTAGRAARNVDGTVVFYADRQTDSIRRAVAEMDRRRAQQIAYNTEHGITPQSIVRAVRDTVGAVYADRDYVDLTGLDAKVSGDAKTLEERRREAEVLMRESAKAMRFEEAARHRDDMRRIEALLLRAGEDATTAKGEA